ncbi:30S ribosomal protein S3 [Clostridia bacterium]|nr:30S ribosomal protein S3 [Clostridia bacterium]
MGQKVNPISYRLQISKNWSSRWFSRNADFKKWLIEDIKIRELIEDRFKQRPTIAKIDIERSPNLATINIFTAKAGAVIGKQGAGVNALKADIEKISSEPIRINIEEIKKPELSAKLVAENIGFQLGKRMNFRRATKMAAANTMAAGAKGVRIEVAGRLNGAEMSRREKLIEGSVPLHTLRANVDFAVHHALIPNNGVIGVKVWVYTGEK